MPTRRRFLAAGAGLLSAALTGCRLSPTPTATPPPSSACTPLTVDLLNGLSPATSTRIFASAGLTRVGASCVQVTAETTQTPGQPPTPVVYPQLAAVESRWWRYLAFGAGAGNPTLQPLDAALHTANFDPGVLQPGLAVAFTDAGHRYAVPYGWDHLVVAVDRPLLTKWRIPPPPPSWTWTGFTQWCDTALAAVHPHLALFDLRPWWPYWPTILTCLVVGFGGGFPRGPGGAVLPADLTAAQNRAGVHAFATFLARYARAITGSQEALATLSMASAAASQRIRPAVAPFPALPTTAAVPAEAVGYGANHRLTPERLPDAARLLTAMLGSSAQVALSAGCKVLPAAAGVPVPWLAGFSDQDRKILGTLPPGAAGLFADPALGYPGADVPYSAVRDLPVLAAPGSQASPDALYAALVTAQEAANRLTQTVGGAR